MCAVEWKKFGELAKNHDKKRKPITAAKRIAGDYPYYGASGIVDYVEGYIFDGNYLLISEDGANLVARNTPIAFSIIGKAWVNNHAHIVEFDNLITQKFVEFYLNLIDLTPYISGGAQPKLNQENLNNIDIPIPSLAKQQEIVSHLDTFTTLISNLESELDMRRKQYEHYRNQLLDFDGVEGVEWKTLGEVCTIITGGEVPENTNKGQLEPSKEYPYAVYTNGKEVYGYTNNYQLDVESVCISSIGANTGAVFYRNGKFTPAIRLKVLIPNAYLLAKYLFYISEITDFSGKNTGSVPNINANYVKRIVIPVPSLKTQQEIVEKLDAFEQLIQSLETEIKLRKQQYEYYREKLLTFEK